MNYSLLDAGCLKLATLLALWFLVNNKASTLVSCVEYMSHDKAL